MNKQYENHVNNKNLNLYLIIAEMNEVGKQSNPLRIRNNKKEK